MSSYNSLNERLTQLTLHLNQKDTELDEKVDEAIQSSFDGLDQDIDIAENDLREGLRQKVAAVKKGINDRKDGLRLKLEAVKNGAKDRANIEAEDALNATEEDLSNEDLVSAHINRWIANQWLKAGK